MRTVFVFEELCEEFQNVYEKRNDDLSLTWNFFPPLLSSLDPCSLQRRKEERLVSPGLPFRWMIPPSATVYGPEGRTF